MPPLRVIHDEPGPGDWNMAVDETLVTSVASSGVPVLRFYGWRPATLSLGYFQRLAERAAHVASAACPVVRRPSGGGAIVHDRELTYCLVLPADAPAARDASRLYRCVHESLKAALQTWGIAVEIRAVTAALNPEPFLCFRRLAAGDVLCQGVKICGSAQRRHAGAVVQHGSILLATSRFAPELPGLAELTGKVIAGVDLAERLLGELSPRLGGTVQQPLTEAELALAERTRQSKYAAADWTAKR